MKDKVNVFIFRRDLRVTDNTSLHAVSQKYPDIPILPIFIFNPKQIEPDANAYYNGCIVAFMLESLASLDTQLNGYLQCFHGDDEDVLKKIATQVDIQCIAFNKDFTPFAVQRDAKLTTFATSRNIEVISANDYTLFDFDILTENGKPYEVFTPFYRKCLKLESKIADVTPSTAKGLRIYKRFLMHRVKTITKYLHQEHMPLRTLIGGREHAHAILKRLEQKMYKKYDSERDYPALDKTTKMSAYLKFGCMSIREAFHTCVKTYGLSHGLVRELIWREFYAHITHFFPNILQGQIGKKKNEPLKGKYMHLSWEDNKDMFQAWCEGKTGFPIVDAAMICMNKTGYMHNRLRMIVASFLVKDLHIDWTHGERYFAQRLVDYDPSSNSGGWQWAASVGADAQPYFRIFNPWLQSEKFDKQCVFIKKWLPALANVPPAHIHAWHAYCNQYQKNDIVYYPCPIVEHAKAVRKTKAMYVAHAL